MRAMRLFLLFLTAFSLFTPATFQGLSREYAESYIRTQDFAETDFSRLSQEMNASRAVSYELFSGNEQIFCEDLLNCPSLAVAIATTPQSFRAVIRTDAGLYLVRQLRGEWVALRDVLPPFARADISPTQPVPGGIATIRGFGVDDTAISQVNITILGKLGPTLVASCNSSDCNYQMALENRVYSVDYVVSVRDLAGKANSFRSSFSTSPDSTAPFLSLAILPSEPGHNENATITAEASDLGGIRTIEIIEPASLSKTGKSKFSPARTLETCGSNAASSASCNYSFNTQRKDWKTFRARATDWAGNNYSVSRKFFFGVTGPDSDGDGIADEVEARISTNPRSQDSDEDGIKDGEEFYGVDADGDGEIDLDLPGMGANPARRDIFIEIDWMENTTDSHRPSNAELQEVVNAFSRKGISLHFDTGNFGGGNPIPYQPQMIWLFDDIGNPNSTNYNQTIARAYNNTNPTFRDFFDAKRRNFDPVRLGYFRYMISASIWTNTGTSNAGGNFYTTLNRSRTGAFWSGTIMHELGHTLGLGHGGTRANGTWDNVNYKPNYLSIMNYHFQLSSIPRLRNGAITFELDYQTAELGDLDENNLDERDGIGRNRAATQFVCPRLAAPLNSINRTFSPAGWNSQQVLSWANGSIDWDCNGRIDNRTVANVNSGDDYRRWRASGAGTSRAVLRSRSDWDKIVVPIKCRNIGMNPDFGYLENSFYNSRFTNNQDCPEDGGTPFPTSFRIRIPTFDFWGDSSGVAAYEEVTVTDEGPLEPIPNVGEYCNGKDDDGNGKVDEGCLDADSDSVPDDVDNCPAISNPRQEDADGNLVGDACEKPVPPANARAETEGSLRKISWDYSGNASSFNVYLASESGEDSFIGNTKERTITDSRQLPPGTHAYLVSAVLPGGLESEFSEPAEFSVSATPTPAAQSPPSDSFGIIVLAIALIAAAIMAYFLLAKPKAQSAQSAEKEKEKK